MDRLTRKDMDRSRSPGSGAPRANLSAGRDRARDRNPNSPGGKLSNQQSAAVGDAARGFRLVDGAEVFFFQVDGADGPQDRQPNG